MLYNNLNNIATSYDALVRSAIQSASGMQSKVAKNELSQIDVEVINANKEGIRISALKEAGINNIGQLCNLPAGRLSAINGIGHQTAIKIRRIVDEMQKAVSSTAKLKIDPKTRNAEQDSLVHGLYNLRHGNSICKQAQGLLASQPLVSVNVSAVTPATGSFKWTFANSAAKSAAAQAFAYLQWLITSDFAIQAQQCILTWQNMAARKVTDAYKDFEQNPVQYYTLLESLGLSHSKQSSVGMPEGLAEYIEKYPLDLRHMQTELRHYQNFGTKYILVQQRVLLGDEMGLGKTIQALAAIADLKSRGHTHFLVVCPASVLVNWQRETEKHTDISSIIIHGWDKGEEFAYWQQYGGVGITNYESLIGLTDAMTFDFGALVVDEAHFVKNPDAQRTKALLVAAKRTQRILYMTGTPLENRVDEMCFLVDCLRPDIASKISTMKTLVNTEKFKMELAPVYLRRVRDDVLVELPDLIENEDWLELNTNEMLSYRKAVADGNFMAMRRVSWDVDLSVSSKAARLLEICEEAKESGRKILVFSFFRDTLQKVCELVGENAIGPITGDVSTEMRQELIDEFGAAPAGTVLVAQVQAGGVGLNIQAASVVIFCEPQIKPSLETQAISRAYRMGQVHDVLVHRLLCVNSIDLRMMDILMRKQTEFDTYAEDSVAGNESLAAMSEGKWIKEVIELERQRLELNLEGTD
jgi:superfamily II DNA or RNA helicase